MRDTNIIVGAGISGLVMAERLSSIGEKVLIIERRNHIGGNCYDYDCDGILVHRYGSHIFHTNDLNVWQYVNKWTSFYPYIHEVRAFVDGAFIPVPFNLNSLYKIFPNKMAKTLESALLKHFDYGKKISILTFKTHKELAFLSDYIYEKIFLNYTKKQWCCGVEELDSSVFDRVPIAISKDNRYFSDIYQGIPMFGYTKMCEKMIENKLIELRLNCEWSEICDKAKEAKRVFFSGAIDEYFNYELGELSYRSLAFEFITLQKPYFQKRSVINYPNNYDFTRIAEYKHFLDAQTSHTIISFEYPKAYKAGLERYYPLPDAKNASLYQRYKQKADSLKNVYFIGRLGQYRYYDMDKAIKQSLALFEAIANKIL